VGLWWSGKHGCHGGNVQVIAASDGWPLWTSPVRPGRGRDTTALHARRGAAAAGRVDLRGACPPCRPGYEYERGALTTPIKHGAGRRLTDDQRTVNLRHAATRAPADRGNSLLETTFKALRRVRLCPWRIGAITAAALVLLRYQHGRTT
jgi:DDE superfamily endonuclease